MATKPEPAMKLERKLEKALSARLKQQPLLAKLRIKLNTDESAKVNQDLVIKATRGEQNPSFSGIFDMSATVSLVMEQRNSVDTLPQFVAFTAALEEILCGVPAYTLAAQLSTMVSNFHCYEITVVDCDDTPQEKAHSCIWTLTAIAMPQDYDTAEKVNS
jgi:hypothetical protein